MDVELHRADQGFRRRAPWLFVAVAILGAIAVWALDAWLDAHLRSSSDDQESLVMVAAGLVALLATVSFGLAVALWQEARLIRSEDRFPATDMRTLRDVPVRHGADARRMAAGMFAGAALALLAGVGILFWGWRLVSLAA